MPSTILRTLARSMATVGLAAATAASGQSPADANPQTDAAAILAAARQALGGDSTLNAVASFSVTGSARVDAGGRANYDESVEFHCQLPDKFVRISHRTMDFGPLGTGSATQWHGFNGNDLIDDDRSTGSSPVPLVIRPEAATPAAAAAERARLVGLQKRAFVEFVTPLFVLPFVSQPLTMSSAGRVAGPTGPADAINAIGIDGFTWQLLFDPSTHLLAAMTWMDKPIVTVSSSQRVTVSPQRGTVGMSSPGPLLPANPTAGLPDVQWQLAFTDYRVDDGVRWPHRIARTYPGRDYELVRLGKFRINPKINASVFKPVK